MTEMIEEPLSVPAIVTVASYEPDTGRIVSIVTCSPEAATQQAGPGEAVILVDSEVRDTTHYIKNEAVAIRPYQDTWLDGLTLRGLPVPCVLRVDGRGSEIAEPTVTLELDHPGVHMVEVRAWPYRNASFEVAANG